MVRSIRVYFELSNSIIELGCGLVVERHTQIEPRGMLSSAIGTFTIAKRFGCMTLTWTTILATWLALQIPLAVLVGRFIRLGMGELEKGASARKAAPAVVWC
jgi:hypothetical protein